MLEVESKKRPTVEEIINHPWMINEHKSIVKTDELNYLIKNAVTFKVFILKKKL